MLLPYNLNGNIAANEITQCSFPPFPSSWAWWLIFRKKNHPFIFGWIIIDVQNKKLIHYCIQDHTQRHTWVILQCSGYKMDTYLKKRLWIINKITLIWLNVRLSCGKMAKSMLMWNIFRSLNFCSIFLSDCNFVYLKQVCSPILYLKN